MISQANLDLICDALETTGYIILPNILPDALTDALYQRIQTLSPQFQVAGIGQRQQNHVNPVIRSDRTQWLEAVHPAENDYLACMSQIQSALNQRFYLSLTEYESHFAHYHVGTFYKRHRDTFQGKSSRIVTTLFYLNPNWQGENGGQLMLYDDSGTATLISVLPHYGQAVFFMSDQFPHEVLPANRERYSIAGWFRNDRNVTI